MDTEFSESVTGVIFESLFWSTTAHRNRIITVVLSQRQNDCLYNNQFITVRSCLCHYHHFESIRIYSEMNGICPCCCCIHTYILLYFINTPSKLSVSQLYSLAIITTSVCIWPSWHPIITVYSNNTFTIFNISTWTGKRESFWRNMPRLFDSDGSFRRLVVTHRTILISSFRR